MNYNMNIEELVVEDQEISKKEKCKLALREAGSAIKDFVEDHSEGIMYTIIYGGMAIVFGQSIRYMHLLNKAAKDGKFFVGAPDSKW